MISFILITFWYYSVHVFLLENPFDYKVHLSSMYDWSDCLFYVIFVKDSLFHLAHSLRLYYITQKSISKRRSIIQVPIYLNVPNSFHTQIRPIDIKLDYYIIILSLFTFFLYTISRVNYINLTFITFRVLVNIISNNHYIIDMK